MSFVSPINAADSEIAAAPDKSGRGLLIALGILALVTLARLTGTVDSDVAWQLWIAQRTQAGANLYRDIIETNPPLWFWMARPIERIASLLQLKIEAVLIVAIAAAVALSLAATNRLLDHLTDKSRTLLLAYAALTLFAMPWMHVGQREQIVLIATLPYAALIAARREARPVSVLLGASIGVGAGLGFSLKHYFLIVPALLELWLLAGTQRRWQAFRAETLALTAVGMLYAGAIVAERDYLEFIVPLVGQAYGSFSAPSLGYLFGPFAVVAFAILAILVVYASALKHSPLASALVTAAFGFVIAYFVQFKGWTYHAIPVLGCGSLALAALITQSPAKLGLLRLAAPAVLCLPFSLSASEAMHPSLPSSDLLQAVADLPPGTPVGFISEDTAIAWSVTLQHRLAYPSRYNGFWMLRAVSDNERAARPDQSVRQLGQQVISNTLVDFRCFPPRRIIAVRGGPLLYFMRDQAFAEFMSHYRLVDRTTLDVFELRSPLRRLASRDCIRGRGWPALEHG